MSKQCSYCKKFGYIERYCKSKNRSDHRGQARTAAETDVELNLSALSFSTKKLTSTDWIVDSGVTNHMTATQPQTNYEKIQELINVWIALLRQAQRLSTAFKKTAQNLSSIRVICCDNM